MGVYIKGMEMPKDYSVIVKIFPDGRVGTIPYVQWFKVELIEGTQAVPVPEPHGRLGDLDAIEKQIDYIANLDWNKQVGASGGMLAALEVVEDAQTIIPAEESET